MLRALFSLSLLALALASPARADERSSSSSGELEARPNGRVIGLGAQLFGTTGVAAKLFLTPSSGFQLAFGFGGHGSVSLALDYVVAPATVSSSLGSVQPYIGGGLGLGFLGTNAFFFVGPSAAIPVQADAHVTCGISYVPQGLPVDVFLEIQPGIAVIPGVGLLMPVNAGARYYF
jgi:hypothetical protein